MAGLKSDTPLPESLTVHGASRVLEVGFSDGQRFRIPFALITKANLDVAAQAKDLD